MNQKDPIQQALEDQLKAAQEQGNKEELESIANDAESGFYEDVAEQAREAIAQLESQEQEIEQQVEEKLPQVEEMGGTAEELSERVEPVQEEMKEVVAGAEGEIVDIEEGQENEEVAKANARYESLIKGDYLGDSNQVEARTLITKLVELGETDTLGGLAEFVYKKMVDDSGAAFFIEDINEALVKVGDKDTLEKMREFTQQIGSNDREYFNSEIDEALEKISQKEMKEVVEGAEEEIEGVEGKINDESLEGGTKFPEDIDIDVAEFIVENRFKIESIMDKLSDTYAKYNPEIESYTFHKKGFFGDKEALSADDQQIFHKVFTTIKNLTGYNDQALFRYREESGERVPVINALRKMAAASISKAVNYIEKNK